MREIFFKANRADNGEWCYGVPLVEGCSKTTYIASYEYSSLAFVQQIEVIPETLCEYTQLKDKKGKRIWENDIVCSSEYKVVYCVFYGKHKITLLNGQKTEWITQDQLPNFSFANGVPFFSVIDQCGQNKSTIPFSSIALIESEKINEN